jgi:hypothetical protein
MLAARFSRAFRALQKLFRASQRPSEECPLFIASVRSGPCGIARAASRATTASTSKSSSVCRMFFCLAIEDLDGREFR